MNINSQYEINKWLSEIAALHDVEEADNGSPVLPLPASPARQPHQRPKSPKQRPAPQPSPPPQQQQSEHEEQEGTVIVGF